LFLPVSGKPFVIPKQSYSILERLFQNDIIFVEQLFQNKKLIKKKTNEKVRK